LEVERRYGKPMRELLQERFAESGGREAVAEVLGIDPQTLDKWLRVTGLVIRMEAKVVPLSTIALEDDGSPD
jgi:hypothetical protein